MSFGNRSAGRPQGLGRDGNEQAADQYFPAAKNTSGMSVNEIAVGGAFIVFAALAGFFLTWMFSDNSSSTTAGSPQASVSEPAPVARSYLKTGPVPDIGVGGDRTMTIKMVETADGFDAIDSELHEQCLKRIEPQAAKYAEVEGSTLLSADKGAAFLACSMRIYTSRFCDPFYRDRLVKRLRAFVSTRTKHLAVAQNARKGEPGRIVIDLDAIGREVNGGVTSGYQPGSFVPTKLGRAIREISAAGLLVADDFGGVFTTLPEELKEYVSDREPADCR